MSEKSEQKGAARQWMDVTSMLRQAASEMTNQAPMVHVEGFSLLESMSAVEIMDPIMDQCCGITGSMKLEDLLTVHYPDSGLTSTIVIKLFQSLMIYEAAFLDGASIMESINQCIFSWEGSWAALQEHATDSLLHRAVLAFCKSVVYCTGCQFKAVMAADIYEDEDFQPSHRSFLSGAHLDEAEVAALLEGVVHELQAQAGTERGQDPEAAYLLALLKARQQLQRFHRDNGNWVDATVREYSRLLKQRHACTAAALESSGGTADKTEPVSGAAGGGGALAALEASIRSAKKRNHDACIKHMRGAQATAAALQDLLDAHQAGVAVAESSSGGVFSDISHPAQCPEIAFLLSSKLVKLHQTGPLRRVEVKSYLASVAYMQAICREVAEVSTAMLSFYEMTTVRTVAEALVATPLPGSMSKPGILTFDHVLHTALHVSAACPHLLTRCYFYCALVMVAVELPALLWASMYCKGLPKALIESELVTLHWLTGNPSNAALATLKGIVVCRNRLLSTRVQNMIDLWGHVSSEAIFVDNRFHIDVNGPANDPDAGPLPAPPSAPLQSQQLQWCSLWALQYTLAAMDLQMSLTSEMELLGAEELDYFYWYWDYLSNTAVYTAEKLRTQRFHLDVEMYEHAKLEAVRARAAAEKEKDKKGKKKGQTAAIPAAVPPLPAVPVQMPASREELVLKAKSMLCRGLYRMCTLAGAPPLGIGVTAAGQPLIDKTEGRWSSWETKFRHRFQPFAELSNPPALEFADFLRATSRTASAVEAQAGAGADASFLGTLAQGTAQCFQGARKVLDEARVGSLAGLGSSPAAAGADKYALSSVVSLTKVSVACSLSAMKVSALIRAGAEEAAAARRSTNGNSNGKSSSKAYALSVNKGYSKQFPVLEITVATATALVGERGTSN